MNKEKNYTFPLEYYSATISLMNHFDMSRISTGREGSQIISLTRLRYLFRRWVEFNSSAWSGKENEHPSRKEAKSLIRLHVLLPRLGHPNNCRLPKVWMVMIRLHDLMQVPHSMLDSMREVRFNQDVDCKALACFLN